MEIIAGRWHLQLEQPRTIKFAYPLVILPDLFTAPAHLGILIGYFASIGWEVYAANPYAPPDERGRSASAPHNWAAAMAAADDLVAAIGREIIPLGHGAGGLIALALVRHEQVKTAVAIAPLVPGFNSPLLRGAMRWFRLRRPRMINPPRGRELFNLFADAEGFRREQLIRQLVPASGALARDIAMDRLAFTPHATPRLIVAGDADRFAPIALTRSFADRLGVRMVTIAGRGHWLFSGRTLELAGGEVQRFLVRALGSELLLLYRDEG